MPTKWLQERAKGSKNGHGMPPHRAFFGWARGLVLMTPFMKKVKKGEKTNSDFRFRPLIYGLEGVAEEHEGVTRPEREGGFVGGSPRSSFVHTRIIHDFPGMTHSLHELYIIFQVQKPTP